MTGILRFLDEYLGVGTLLMTMFHFVIQQSKQYSLCNRIVLTNSESLQFCVGQRKPKSQGSRTIHDLKYQLDIAQKVSKTLSATFPGDLGKDLHFQSSFHHQPCNLSREMEW
jgi:hypothetical protein